MQSEDLIALSSGWKLLKDDEWNYLEVRWLIVGNKKVVTLIYTRKSAITLTSNPTTTELSVNRNLPSAFRPTSNIYSPYARAVIGLTADGTINGYNGTGSNLTNYAPVATFTYIVDNIDTE